MTHTEHDTEALADLIAEARDGYPRLADDMDSGELADVILESDWLRDYTAARLAERDHTLTNIRNLADEWDERIAERRQDAAAIGPQDRQAFVHFTAGLSESRDLLRVVLDGQAPTQATEACDDGLALGCHDPANAAPVSAHEGSEQR